MKYFTKIIAFCLAFVIFMTSSGIILVQHFCTASGIESKSFFTSKKCCCKNSEAQSNNIEITSESCCENTSQIIKTDTSSLFAFFSYQFAIIQEKKWFSLERTFVLKPIAQLFFLLDLPPPLSAKHLRSLYCKFII